MKRLAALPWPGIARSPLQRPAARSASALVPSPGLVWGPYPMRPAMVPDAWAHAWSAGGAHFQNLVAVAWARLAGPIARRGEQSLLRRMREQQDIWLGFDAATRRDRLHDLRARLARDGWSDDGVDDRRAEALGCVAAAGVQTLCRSPFDAQLLAADALLDDRLAEMATGEGKTYAAALAAAVAALAGVPVHVMTANDYLVQRDAAALDAFYRALGLSVGVVLGSSTPEQRRAAYACDLTYVTAREVAFDHLRDGLSAGSLGPSPTHTAAPPTLLRGLCMAVLDEADSLLIDEATLPLVLSETVDDAAQRAACFQALALARQLQPDRDVRIDVSAGRVTWLAAGEARLQELAAGLAGAWHNRRHGKDLVGAALEALHLLHRDQHYLVRGGKVELLDAVTGRAAPGRVWSRGVQSLVELKEGVALSPATRTCAQISFQRFFARYVRLCGTSGTLAECRGELASLYARRIVPICLNRPSQRQRLPDRLFADAASRQRAMVSRAAELQRSGRPLLIGTDSVGDSLALSAQLTAAGIAHRVLNAQHDADEADIVAQAGQHGAVTVATRMAGRGTDIALGQSHGKSVAALGGLHVLCCQDNLSRRLDRQLIGRSARQGDPGSAEVWRCLEVPVWCDSWTSRLWKRCRKQNESGDLRVPVLGLRVWAAWLQQAEERRGARRRRQQLEQDQAWERQLDFSRESG